MAFFASVTTQNSIASTFTGTVSLVSVFPAEKDVERMRMSATATSRSKPGKVQWIPGVRTEAPHSLLDYVAPKLGWTLASLTLGARPLL